MTTVIDQIDRALDMTAAIVKGITDDRLAVSTPCQGWDVRTELNHLVGGMRIFAAELTGTDPGAAHDSDWLGTDPQGAYATAADLDRAAWHRPDALATTVRLSFGAVPAPMAALIHLTEVLVHGVDLAIATGQETLVDEPACDQPLTIMQGMDFGAFRRPGMFGPEACAPRRRPRTSTTPCLPRSRPLAVLPAGGLRGHVASRQEVLREENPWHEFGDFQLIH